MKFEDVCHGIGVAWQVHVSLSVIVHKREGDQHKREERCLGTYETGRTSVHGQGNMNRDIVATARWAWEGGYKGMLETRL